MVIEKLSYIFCPYFSQQMLCEERGLFLEIADLIRGLGLTILKGVLEARNDKIWARFAVEVSFSDWIFFLYISSLISELFKKRHGVNDLYPEVEVVSICVCQITVSLLHI